MSTEAITVNRRDISIYEEPEYEDHYGNKQEKAWYATFSGRTSSGEYLSFGRRDATVSGALSAVEAEIEALGWEITA